jgi:hypothetical protein
MRRYGPWVRNNAARNRYVDARERARSAVSTTAVTLVAVLAGVFGLALYVGLILAPAWSSYSRMWERVAATVLSLYVLLVLVGGGVLAALAAVYFWG